MPQKPRPLLAEERFRDLAESGTRAELVTALAEFVKVKAGRKRVYDTPAKRAKAHRQKQKEELDRLRAEAEKGSK